MIKGQILVKPTEVEVAFSAPPVPALRQALKAWRFRFDGSSWRRDAGFNIGRMLDELDRFPSVHWTYEIADGHGVRHPARVERVPGRTPKLVADEASTGESEPEPEQAPREIRASRCIECGTLTALEPGEQPELDRRLREAVENAIAAAKAAGLPPYLAAAPVPAHVRVVHRHVCRACAREAW